MPSVENFLHGFKIVQGATYDDFILSKIEIHHSVIKRYYKYGYRLLLKFVNNSGKISEENLLKTVQEMTRTPRIIYGVRNPYFCYFDSPTRLNLKIHDQFAEVQLLAYAVRQKE